MVDLYDGKPLVTTAGVTFVDFVHFETLAAGANYLPPAATMGFFQGQDVAVADLHQQFWDDAAWFTGEFRSQCFGDFHQNADRETRFLNADGANAWRMLLTGRTWTGYTDYRYYEDLAGAATYISPAQSFGVILSEAIEWNQVHPQMWDGGAWRAGEALSQDHGSWHQDAAQSMRWENDDPGALKIHLSGAIWA